MISGQRVCSSSYPKMISNLDLDDPDFGCFFGYVPELDFEILNGIIEMAWDNVYR